MGAGVKPSPPMTQSLKNKLREGYVLYCKRAASTPFFRITTEEGCRREHSSLYDEVVDYAQQDKEGRSTPSRVEQVRGCVDRYWADKSDGSYGNLVWIADCLGIL